MPWLRKEFLEKAEARRRGIEKRGLGGLEEEEEDEEEDGEDEQNE